MVCAICADLVVAAFGSIVGNMFKSDARLPSAFIFLIISAIIMGSFCINRNSPSVCPA
jgi:hypothetical protein